MVDTSTEAVEKLAKRIHASCGCAFGSNAEQPVAGTLRALLAERDALKAERDKFEAALARACLVGGITYLIERATKAEAEVERLKAERDEAIEGWHVIHPNITVQDAARVLVEAINSDMATFNKALGTLTVHEDMPTQHFFAEAILAYAAALRAIAEGK